MTARNLAHSLPLAVLMGTLCASGCVDVRDFSGSWAGPRVGDAPILSVGFAADATATLEIDQVDLSQLRATLTTSGDELSGAEIRPLAGAEADALGDLRFGASPARVFLAFADANDGGGPATVFVALFEDDRVEVRILRGGATPLYGVFLLHR